MAQNDTDMTKSFFNKHRIGFIADYQFHEYSSIGFSIGKVDYSMGNNHLLMGRGFVLGINKIFNYENEKKQIESLMAVKLSSFINIVYLHCGANIEYYLKDNRYNLQIIPEIGVGFVCLYITFGKRLELAKNNLNVGKNNVISIRLIVPIDQGIFGIVP